MQTWTFTEARPPAGGPWDNEPDKAQWVDAATDLDCLVVRHVNFGYLCGYVGVPDGHALHGRQWQGIEPLGGHRGVNYSAYCQEGYEGGAGICHIPGPGRPAKIWWFGFDCGHLGGRYSDYHPTTSAVVQEILGNDSPYSQGVYRDFEYVKTEVTKLARQLRETR